MNYHTNRTILIIDGNEINLPPRTSPRVKSGLKNLVMNAPYGVSFDKLFHINDSRFKESYLRVMRDISFLNPGRFIIDKDKVYFNG